MANDISNTVLSAPSGASPGQAKTPHHFAFVVNDLELAARHWHDVAGVGPFLVLEHIPFGQLLIDGEPAIFDHTAAFASYGPMFLELQYIHRIEPESAGRRLRPPGGSGLHHVAYVLENAPAESARLADCGLPAVIEASNNDLSVTMHDARESCGFVVELHQDTAFMTDFFGQVRAAGQHWDGRELLHSVAG
jgi:Glyoxalase/Bleomycin resistance protein/Dioxygenase superfamily